MTLAAAQCSTASHYPAPALLAPPQQPSTALALPCALAVARRPGGGALQAGPAAEGAAAPAQPTSQQQQLFARFNAASSMLNKFASHVVGGEESDAAAKFQVRARWPQLAAWAVLDRADRVGSVSRHGLWARCAAPHPPITPPTAVIHQLFAQPTHHAQAQLHRLKMELVETTRVGEQGGGGAALTWPGAGSGTGRQADAVE